LEKRPLTVKFSKFCSESFHRCLLFKFREIWPVGNRWNLVLLTCPKKFRLALQLSLLCGLCPQSARASPRLCTQECSRFHPNLFTFRGVIAERVNTAKTWHKVNPTFGWSLASSQIINYSIKITIRKWPKITA